jgi:sodium/hydrogen antiporter
MAWDQIEPTPTHMTVLIFSGFLIIYSLFSQFIQNRLHLSEPPLATLVGIICGPKGFGIFTPRAWGVGDGFTQELTRIVLGVQCFAVGVKLPQHFIRREWWSLAILLGPVMAIGWLICAALIYTIFDTTFPTALTISACLSPTDPILAAAILSHSVFSERIPPRVRNILAAESGCNDGSSFPYLYVGLAILMAETTAETLRRWFLVTILWQCLLGILAGTVIGQCAYWCLRKAHMEKLIAKESYLVFYVLLALLCVGVGSLLGIDDFLVAFTAGATFARHGWFQELTTDSELPQVLDLQLNSSVFIYFGASIPWETYLSATYPYLTPARLLAFLVLVLLLRRIPVVLALKQLMPGFRTYREALLAGHFGPMGVGALFLAIEARAQLETDTSIPIPFPPDNLPGPRQRAVDLIWPIVTFIVLGSTFVHGLSPLVVSLVGHFRRREGERAPLLGAETDRFSGMGDDDDEA